MGCAPTEHPTLRRSADYDLLSHDISDYFSNLRRNGKTKSERTAPQTRELGVVRWQIRTISSAFSFQTICICIISLYRFFIVSSSCPLPRAT